MSQNHEQNPFPAEDDLVRLDMYLRDQHQDDGLLLDGVHGLMTALALGPEPATPDEWLPEVLRQPFTNEGEGAEILTVLARLNDAVREEMSSEDYAPILGGITGEDGTDMISAAGWCEGFSRGIDLRAGIWETRLAEDQELMNILSPIMALAIEDGVFVSEAEFEKLSEDDYHACIEKIPDSVTALAHYWRVHPPSEHERAVGGNSRVAGRTLH